MSTLLKYAGNKQRLMDQVSPALGDWSGVSRYIEPFAGALGCAGAGDAIPGRDLEGLQGRFSRGCQHLEPCGRLRAFFGGLG